MHHFRCCSLPWRRHLRGLPCGPHGSRRPRRATHALSSKIHFSAIQRACKGPAKGLQRAWAVYLEGTFRDEFEIVMLKLNSTPSSRRSSRCTAIGVESRQKLTIVDTAHNAHRSQGTTTSAGKSDEDDDVMLLWRCVLVESLESSAQRFPPCRCLPSSEARVKRRRRGPRRHRVPHH